MKKPAENGGLFYRNDNAHAICVVHAADRIARSARIAHAICMVHGADRMKRSDRADIAGFFAFRAIRAGERHALVFSQALEAFRLDVLEVGEQVRAACVRCDEAEALGIVEPFHGAGLSSHF